MTRRVKIATAAASIRRKSGPLNVSAPPSTAPARRSRRCDGGAGGACREKQAPKKRDGSLTRARGTMQAARRRSDRIQLAGLGKCGSVRTVNRAGAARPAGAGAAVLLRWSRGALEPEALASQRGSKGHHCAYEVMRITRQGGASASRTISCCARAFRASAPIEATRGSRQCPSRHPLGAIASARVRLENGARRGSERWAEARRKPANQFASAPLAAHPDVYPPFARRMHAAQAAESARERAKER